MPVADHKLLVLFHLLHVIVFKKHCALKSSKHMWLVLKATFAPTTAKRLLACEERFLDLTGVKAAAQLGNTVLLSFFQDPLSFCFVYKIQSSPLPVLEKF